MQWASLAISVAAIGIALLAARNSHRSATEAKNANHRADKPEVTAKTRGLVRGMTGLECEITSPRDLDVMVVSVTHLTLNGQQRSHRGVWAQQVDNLRSPFGNEAKGITFRQVRAGVPCVMSIAIEPGIRDILAVTFRVVCGVDRRPPWTATPSFEVSDFHSR